MSKWALELSEFDITFMPSKVIKDQALADFLVELTPDDQNEEIGIQKFFVDGSSGKDKCRAGIVLIDPTNMKIEYNQKINHIKYVYYRKKTKRQP